MKLKVSDTIMLYNIFAGCQLNQIDDENIRNKMIDNAIELLKHVRDFETARDKVAKEKQNEGGDLMEKAVQALLDKEVDVDFKVFTLDELKPISRSISNWTVGMFGVLSSMIENEEEK